MANDAYTNVVVLQGDMTDEVRVSSMKSGGKVLSFTVRTELRGHKMYHKVRCFLRNDDEAAEVESVLKGAAMVKVTGELNYSRYNGKTFAYIAIDKKANVVMVEPRYSDSPGGEENDVYDSEVPF